MIETLANHLQRPNSDQAKKNEVESNNTTKRRGRKPGQKDKKPRKKSTTKDI